MTATPALAGSPYPPLWADLDGPLHYVDLGGPADGPVVVCVHGLGGSHLNWLPLAALLTPTCRVLALDLPAHGLTPLGGRSASVQEVRHVVHRFVSEVAGAPVVLIGNSMGGMLSILVTADHPADVAGLVLLDPALPQPVTSRLDPLVAAAFVGYALPGVGERVLRERRSRFTAEQVVRQTLNLCTVDRHRVDPRIVELSVELARYRMDHPELDAGFLGAARSLLRVLFRRRQYEHAMQSITAPVLLVHGDRDRLVNVAAARSAARRRPTWRYEELPDIGHVPMLEATGATADLVLDWLATQGAAAAELARPRGRASDLGSSG